MYSSWLMIRYALRLDMLLESLRLEASGLLLRAILLAPLVSLWTEPPRLEDRAPRLVGNKSDTLELSDKAVSVFQRFVIVAQDGKVMRVNVEQDSSAVTTTSADVMITEV